MIFLTAALVERRAIGLVYLPGSVILGLAFVALGVWWLRSGRSAADARGDPLEFGQ